MPIYEFKCSDCSNEFEILVFRSDEKVNCPSCDSQAVDKLMSACRHKSSGGDSYSSSGSSYAGGGGCGGCSGGHCGSCH